MNVKICPKCGTENDKSFVICKKCGESLDQAIVTQSMPTDSTSAGKNQTANTTVAGNSVASLLKIIAIITYICGFICGIILGKDGWGDFYFGLALIYWVAGFVCGSMFLGFSEIIRLLHEISQKIKG